MDVDGIIRIPYENRDVALDGLRGVAVLLVIAGHLCWARFGWVGVQLFFVLSGFLITRILLRDREYLPLGEYLKNFYLRRALRILPALYLYLAVIAVVAWLLQSWEPMQERLAPAALFYYNFSVLGQAIQFNLSSWHGFATNHFWSLAVEEHFYLLWPLVVYSAGRRHLPKVVLTAIVLGPVLRWICARYWVDLGPEFGAFKTKAVYVMSTSHLDAFAAGALIALLSPAAIAAATRRPYLLVSVAGLLVLACVGYNVAVGDTLRNSLLSLGFPVFMKRGQQYLWGYSLLNLLFAVLLVQSLSAGGLGRFLSRNVLTFTGRISYGLYIVHLPLLALFLWLGRTLLPGGLSTQEIIIWVSVPYLLSCFVVAWLSFRYYEAPLLKLKALWSSKPSHKRRAQPAPALSDPKLLPS